MVGRLQQGCVMNELRVIKTYTELDLYGAKFIDGPHNNTATRF